MVIKGTQFEKLEKSKHLWKVLCFLMVVVWLSVSSCAEKSTDGMILIVQESENDPVSKSQLVLVDSDGENKNPIILVDGFYEVGSPKISYDGKSVIFQGKPKTEDPWQIWQYNLKTEDLRKVSEADFDCVDPVYLPDGRIVYCRFVPDYSGYHVLETCDSNGSDVKQITFAPVDFRDPTVLMDGRILAQVTEVYPKSTKTKAMVMRPDGTKIELFYESPEDGLLESRRIEKRPRPKKLPSEVNQDVETALLVCMDANLTDLVEDDIQEGQLPRKSAQVELLGLKGSLGKVDLEADGSVYLKVKADTPFRMQTLDEEGLIVQGPSSWLQLRPNERRGCVGCHAGHTRVPENIQPLAVQKEPVEIPQYEQAIMASRITKTPME
jgi:hypothetical protein